MIVKPKYVLQLIVLFALLASLVPGSVSALAAAPPPVDIFQLPWEQGLSWIAMDGFDNGIRRLSTSPHNYKMGGAVDFAPHVNMKIGEDTSNFWVTAAAAGTIIETSTCHVKIDHGNGWITEYWHLDKLQVVKGAAVYRNQRLGIIADSKYQKVCVGNEFPGPHLHFVMRPIMKQTVFAGWSINYNTITNITNFSKSGETVGSYQPILNVPGLQIAWRDAIIWDTVYIGSVDAYRYERWSLQLKETNKFTLTAAPVTSGLTPLIVLLDANGHEITRAAGSLTSTQPAGTYVVQIQPQTGNGFYTLLLKKNDLPVLTPTPTLTAVTPTATLSIPITPTATLSTAVTPTATLLMDITPTPTVILSATITPISTTIISTETPPAWITPTATQTPLPTGPSVSTNVMPTSINMGGTAAVIVNLNNVPTEGYSSAEFMCTYNPIFAEVSAITVANLFGTDSVTAINGPQNGSFIFAIAGSHSNKAVVSGTALTFSVKGLQLGQTAIECTARISKGDQILAGIPSLGAANLSILENVSTLVFTPTTTSTALPLSDPVLTGQVLASKPVTIRLYNTDNLLVTSINTNVDGKFNLLASAGTYTVIAAADGFLSAQGSVTLTDGSIRTMPIVSLPAGDVDNNGIIDQYDAMTIGMSYNTAFPTSADLNNDGLINVLDLELLARNYRKSGALAW